MEISPRVVYIIYYGLTLPEDLLRYWSASGNFAIIICPQVWNASPACPVCQQHNEIVECNFARAVLSGCRLSLRMVDFHHTTLHQKVQFWLDTIDQGQEFFTCTLVGFWTIWKVRNEKVFNNADPDPCRTVIRINELSATILDAFNQHKSQLPHPTHDPQLRSVAFPLPGNSYNRWKFCISMHVDRSTGFYGVAAVGNDTIGN